MDGNEGLARRLGAYLALTRTGFADSMPDVEEQLLTQSYRVESGRQLARSDAQGMKGRSMMPRDKLVIQKALEEQSQAHSTRQDLYLEIEKLVGLPVVSFFTSFRYPVMLEDSDADMLEGVLQKCDLPKGFALLLSSPGGSALAADRMINICRSYSGSGQYTAIVPGKAKSAATMVCLGASKIMMGRTSELGTIDPQIVVREDDKVKWFSIYNLVKTYETLFDKAVKEKGNLQPYLQQLANYDAREIAEFRSALSLSEDITIKSVKTGMLSKLPKREIKRKIGIFLTPEEAKMHGRPIYAVEAAQCGLNVEIIEVKDKLWPPVYELYVRLNNYVSRNNVGKSIESAGHSFMVRVEG